MTEEEANALREQVAALREEVRELRENQVWNVVLGGVTALLGAWFGAWLHRVFG